MWAFAGGKRNTWVRLCKRYVCITKHISKVPFVYQPDWGRVEKASVNGNPQNAQ